jgi:hypothetical protein
MALRIPNKDALAARQNDAERFVVPGAKARFPRDEISDRWIHVSLPVGANWQAVGYRHFPASECPMIIKLPQAFCLRIHWVTLTALPLPIGLDRNNPAGLLANSHYKILTNKTI